MVGTSNLGSWNGHWYHDVKTTKQIWDVELPGSDSDAFFEIMLSNCREIHHKQMQTPDLCSMNLCQSTRVQSWKRCCFLQAQRVPKNQTAHSSENIPPIWYIAQNEPMQCTKARFSAKALVALGKMDYCPSNRFIQSSYNWAPKTAFDHPLGSALDKMASPHSTWGTQSPAPRTPRDCGGQKTSPEQLFS